MQNPPPPPPPTPAQLSAPHFPSSSRCSTPRLPAASYFDEEPPPVVLPEVPDTLGNTLVSLGSVVLMWTGAVAAAYGGFLAVGEVLTVTTLVFGLTGLGLMVLGFVGYR